MKKGKKSDPPTSVVGPFKINDRVSYTTENYTQTGTIIELDGAAWRARVKWDGRRVRTWVRFIALKKLDK
jgi:hypothetical protein